MSASDMLWISSRDHILNFCPVSASILATLSSASTSFWSRARKGSSFQSPSFGSFLPHVFLQIFVLSASTSLPFKRRATMSSSLLLRAAWQALCMEMHSDLQNPMFSCNSSWRRPLPSRTISVLATHLPSFFFTEHKPSTMSRSASSSFKWCSVEKDRACSMATPQTPHWTWAMTSFDMPRPCEKEVSRSTAASGPRTAPAKKQ
mmetsp:Transcript_70692/g.200331  ORF Transcript_70692/g.200331 Transcript_70692/m.200331 type:complete len:204 (-) Transcript_70692:89-700(-)